MLNFEIKKLTYLLHAVLILKMVTVGFEPTHPKIIDLKSTALDHSAMLPCKN